MKEWVIYSPTWKERPKEVENGEERHVQIPEKDPDCPFCPGNESDLQGVLTKSDHPEEDHWQTRAVSNKYPALTPEGDNQRFEQGFYLAMSGYGHHEGLIESYSHNKYLPCMTPQEVRNVIEMYHSRYRIQQEDEKNKMVILFKNHGPNAGTSLLHPHAQLIATSVVQQYVRIRENQARKYYDDWGRCIYCDLIQEEEDQGLRVITENERFISIVPYFARAPYEIWIMPKGHQSSFGNIKEGEKGDFGKMLQDQITRLHELLQDPDYNYVIHSSLNCQKGQPYHDWYLQIHPRITPRAGFEIGSGMNINPSIPEEDARTLRVFSIERVVS
jgi:UDPglucose--hexose-1-phosphate uridylyltransferase